MVVNGLLLDKFLDFIWRLKEDLLKLDRFDEYTLIKEYILLKENIEMEINSCRGEMCLEHGKLYNNIFIFIVKFIESIEEGFSLSDIPQNLKSELYSLSGWYFNYELGDEKI